MLAWAIGCKECCRSSGRTDSKEDNVLCCKESGETVMLLAKPKVSVVEVFSSGFTDKVVPVLWKIGFFRILNFIFLLLFVCFGFALMKCPCFVN